MTEMWNLPKHLQVTGQANYVFILKNKPDPAQLKQSRIDFLKSARLINLTTVAGPGGQSLSHSQRP